MTTTTGAYFDILFLISYNEPVKLVGYRCHYFIILHENIITVVNLLTGKYVKN